MDEIRVGVGVRPDSEEEHRLAPDFEVELASKIRAVLSPSYQSTTSDLRSFSPRTRHNQGSTSTCVANSVTRAAEIKQIQQLYDQGIEQGLSSGEALNRALTYYVPLSRRATYFMARDLMPLRADGTKETLYDDGTQVSLAAEGFRRWGACPEVPIPGRPETECWPWSTELRDLQTSPSWMAMRHAYVHKIDKWAKIKSFKGGRAEDVIANLAVGNPVAWATRVGQAWRTYNGKSALGLQQDTIGNHATLLVGWDPNLYGGVFIFENSWGPWGDNGFGYVSPDVIEDSDSFDFVAMLGGWEPWSKAA
jgi:Papain family cysteine protease